MSYIFWKHSTSLPSHAYTCGFCGHYVSSALGFEGSATTHNNKAFLFICPHCYSPTFFDYYSVQTPGPVFGKAVKFIPDKNVESLYEEARKCFTIKAYTSSVMCCRKLLMNIAIKEGAVENDNFANYVSYLNSNGFIPPKGKHWVDAIRKLGNEANHSIEFRTVEDAKLALTFTEMLLRFIYEMPGLMQETMPTTAKSNHKNENG